MTKLSGRNIEVQARLTITLDVFKCCIPTSQGRSLRRLTITLDVFKLNRLGYLDIEEI